MEFSKEDKKKIGNNVLAIIRGFGCENVGEFIIRIGQLNEKGTVKPKGLSESMLNKIIKGEYDIKEKHIRDIASYSMYCTYEDIVSLDLTEIIEPGMFNEFENPMEYLELFESEEFSEIFKTIFPFVNNEEVEKLPEFCKAYSFYQNKLFPLTESIAREMFDAEETFKRLFEEKNIPEAGVNYLSIVGLFFAIATKGIGSKVLENVKNTSIDEDNLVFSRKLKDASESKAEVARKEKNKKDLLANYSDVDDYLSKLSTFDEYKDYVNYYNALRYFYGFLDNSKTKLSENEMNIFGMSLLKQLKEIGNKYAVNFFKCQTE